jgi:hypothetical protein
MKKPHETNRCSWLNGWDRTTMNHRMIAKLVLAIGLMLCIAHAQQPPAKQHGIETDVIHLTPYGFFPKALTRSPGPHFVYIHNATGLRDFSLNVTLTGLVQKQQVLTPASPHLKDVWDLPPGTYTLAETTHPAWVCTITVK